MNTNRKMLASALAVGLLTIVARPSQAQQATLPPAAPAATAAQAPVPDLPLAIPSPPGTTVAVEVDLHDDDLLGVFKSLLRGVGQAANTVPLSTRPPSIASRGPSDAQIAAILSNADLSDVFKDVTHIHFVVLTTPTPDVAPVPRAKAAKAPIVPAAPPLPDQTAFYETAFGAEGGHRIIYVNNDPVHVLMTSFGHARGFAFMAQAPGTLVILRADGYPDLSKLAALATSVGAAAGKAALNAPTTK